MCAHIPNARAWGWREMRVPRAGKEDDPSDSSHGYHPLETWSLSNGTIASPPSCNFLARFFYIPHSSLSLLFDTRLFLPSVRVSSDRHGASMAPCLVTSQGLLPWVVHVQA